MIKTIMTTILIVCSALALLAQPTLSITFDDGVTDDMPGYSFDKWNNMLLDHLSDKGIKTVFFVTGSNKVDAKGQMLLKSWNDNGHKIANHTFTHKNYSSKQVTFELFRKEFLATDSIIRKFDNYIRLFRYPYLKEGDTRDKVMAARQLLKNQGYRNGHVTIDASDWYINGRLLKRLREDPKADLASFRQFYLDHLLDRAKYYEELAFKLTGRHIKHTLLLHHNLAAALFVGDVVEMFRAKGWTLINAQDAFQDKIFSTVPSTIPAGESLIWALAKESGRYEAELRYPAEDENYEKEKMDKLGL